MNTVTDPVSQKVLCVSIWHPLLGGARDGAVVTALASHQCGPGSNPAVDAICGLSLFVVGSLLCSERFSSGYSGFPLSPKTNIFKFQFDQESGRRRTTLWMCYLQIIIYLFIYVSFLLFEINTLASVWKSKLWIRIKKDGRTNFALMFTHFRSCWFSETANERGSCDNFT